MNSYLGRSPSESFSVYMNPLTGLNDTSAIIAGQVCGRRRFIHGEEDEKI